MDTRQDLVTARSVERSSCLLYVTRTPGRESRLQVALRGGDGREGGAPPAPTPRGSALVAAGTGRAHATCSSRGCSRAPNRVHLNLTL